MKTQTSACVRRKTIAAWLILVGISLSGCQKTCAPAAPESAKATDGDDVVVWYKMPPVDRVSRRDFLIPILRIDGAYYTVCQGFEIPLKEVPEGLQWALTPSSMSDTTIGFFGPSEMCFIRIVDRQRESFDDFYVADKVQPARMTRVERPAGLLDATARRPQTLDDFLGFYQPLWLPWARMEVRKDGPRYWITSQSLDPPEPSGTWTARDQPREITPLADRLGFSTHFGGGPKEIFNLTYNDARRRFELIKMDYGIVTPLARVSPSPGSEATLPPLPIGIPAWH